MLCGGVLVLNRMALMRLAEQSGVLTNRRPLLDISVSDIFRKYRGFDGDPWPDLADTDRLTLDGLADPNDLEWACGYRTSLDCRSECDLIFLTNSDHSMPPFDGWRLAGLDVGWFQGEELHYSIVLNEVIFGIHKSLLELSRALNGSLLFDSMSVAQILLERRREIAIDGGDVEILEGDPQVVQVFVSDISE